MKTIMAAAALAVTLAGSTVAAKADTGTVGFPGGAPGSVYTEPKGNFTQLVSVTIDSASTLEGIAAGASTRGLTFSFVSLYNSVQTFFQSAVSGASFSVFPDSTVVLNPGSYTLAVKGNVTGTTGSFNGNYTVSSVPLPTSVALFGTAILGLGAFGAIRRKGKAAAGAAA